MPGQTMPAAAARPLPFVSPIFSDNMVLQRGKPDKIWGWSDPGDTVRVEIGEHYPDIRFFPVGGHPAYHHVDVIDGNWRLVSPDTASWISAVGYYFARKLEQEIHAPIGLVIDSVGETPAESWTSAAALRPLHDFDVPLAELDHLKAANAPARLRSAGHHRAAE